MRENADSCYSSFLLLHVFKTGEVLGGTRASFCRRTRYFKIISIVMTISFGHRVNRQMWILVEMVCILSIRRNSDNSFLCVTRLTLVVLKLCALPGYGSAILSIYIFDFHVFFIDLICWIHLFRPFSLRQRLSYCILVLLDIDVKPATIILTCIDDILI